MAQRAANDPAQHVASAFVERQHAIDDQERAGADVIGDYAQRFVFQIRGAGQLAGELDQVLEQVDFVIAVDLLQDRGEALETHAGIDAGCRQGRQAAVVGAVELHEHEVPDLDVAIAVLVRGPRRATGDVRAMVVEDFGARTAGAGIGHLPEVVGGERRTLVVADADDALGRDADHVLPDIVGLVVGLVDRDQQAVFRQLPDLGQQFPGPDDRLALEVVAERPVAEHLEKSVMARGIADLIEVVVLAAGAQAALHVDDARARRLFAAEERVLERHHARIGEHQGRIAGRNQRTGRHDQMPLRAEEFEEVGTDFGAGFHQSDQSRNSGHADRRPRCRALSRTRRRDRRCRRG